MQKSCKNNYCHQKTWSVVYNNAHSVLYTQKCQRFNMNCMAISIKTMLTTEPSLCLSGFGVHSFVHTSGVKAEAGNKVLNIYLVLW